MCILSTGEINRAARLSLCHDFPFSVMSHSSVSFIYLVRELPQVTNCTICTCYHFLNRDERKCEEGHSDVELPERLGSFCSVSTNHPLFGVGMCFVLEVFRQPVQQQDLSCAAIY